eukprot:gnl/TRDRNA2_/TRDRNA2_92138_c0_seq2.p1 gnl/TRDRNA2_/TRDRNA2_92138_c0~~gnl/TRDRNA2_/TRDRNA2_92138_c0_seq2.p1  ORF type:complete len:548 (+),score=71.32 gnl/TRDRNA2_/TRDRNA2_92138_c0_seq2:72-1646(+)
MPWSDTHRLQLRGWQSLLVLGGSVDRGTAEQFLIPEFFRHFRAPHVPDVRDYQEMLGCILCSRFEDLAVEPFLVPALLEFDVNVQVSASLLVIVCFLFKRWSTKLPNFSAGEKWPPYVAPVVHAAAPYLIHNSAYARGTAAWAFFCLLDVIGTQGITDLAPKDAPMLNEIYRFLSTHKECRKMRDRLRLVFAEFDPFENSALACLTEHSVVLPALPLSLRGQPVAAAEADAVAAALNDKRELHIFADGDFQPTANTLELLKSEISTALDSMWNRHDFTQYGSVSDEWQGQLSAALAAGAAGWRETKVPDRGSPVAPEEIVEQDMQDAQPRGDAAGAVQRKFVPLEAPAPPDEDRVGKARVRAPLVVAASMVEKVPNLGGLCRTCEIFNCEALCVPNARVSKDQTFQAIAVTAEKWLPLREVPRGSALRTYLLQMRRKGYALVGVEQTHDSVQLDEYTFSERTVLVLGAEKEGIDAELLPLLDACVEIPQSGQIRSLNVHVSGSLAVWEYTRQRRAVAAATAPSR